MNTWKLPRIRWKATLLSAGLYAFPILVDFGLDYSLPESLYWMKEMSDHMAFRIGFLCLYCLLSWFRSHRLLEWVLIAWAMLGGAFLGGVVLGYLLKGAWILGHSDEVWVKPGMLLLYYLLMLLLILFSKLPVWGFLLSRHAWRRWKARREAR